MSEAENVAAQKATAEHAFNLDQQLHQRRDIEVLYRIYMEKRLASQAAFYESRVRENQSNADFTFVLTTVIMALSAFVATISAFGNSPFLSLLSAILPAFAALLAAFRQLYGWERQISIYRDAMLGLERVKLLTPDKDRMALADLSSVYPKLVSSGESVFTGEVNQWGQFVQSAEKEGETTDERATNLMIGSLPLTEAQLDTLRKIINAGTPKAAFSQTITVHPEETNALPAGSGGGTPAAPPAVPVTVTHTQTTVVERVPSPVQDSAPIEDVVPVVDAGSLVEESVSAADAVPPVELQTPVTEDIVPDEALPVSAVEEFPQEWEPQEPPPPEAISALTPGALHVDAPQAPPEGTFSEQDPNNAPG